MRKGRKRQFWSFLNIVRIHLVKRWNKKCGKHIKACRYKQPLQCNFNFEFQIPISTVL